MEVPGVIFDQPWGGLFHVPSLAASRYQLTAVGTFEKPAPLKSKIKNQQFLILFGFVVFFGFAEVPGTSKSVFRIAHIRKPRTKHFRKIQQS